MSPTGRFFLVSRLRGFGSIRVAKVAHRPVGVSVPWLARTPAAAGFFGHLLLLREGPAVVTYVGMGTLIEVRQARMRRYRILWAKPQKLLFPMG